MSEATSTDVYLIPVQNWSYLLTKFGEIIKKAEKLGVEAPKLTILSEKSVTKKNPDTGIEYERHYFEVTVEGEAPKLAGWTLVAVVEQIGDEYLTRVVPGQECPEHYRNCGMYCDHCNFYRKRKETFILRKDDEDGPYFTQVGRNCLSDFLGGVSPEGLVKYCEWISQIMYELGEAGDDYYASGGSESQWSVDYVISTASIVIRRLGWLSRTKAMEIGDYYQSTADHVKRILLCRPQDSFTREWIKNNKLTVEDRDLEEAEAAIEWGKTLGGEGSSDYEHNLGALCRAELVKYTHIGLISSLIPAYKRHCDRVEELRRMKETKENNFLGEVGKRQVFENVTVKSTKYYEGDYGLRVQVRFEDEKGNTIVWWASGEPDWVKDGETYSIKGTVKKHDTWRDWNQTIVNRVVKVVNG